MANIYDVNGNAIPIANYDRTVKGIAHRGYSSIAPENTLPAYRLAKEMGFFYVECDVSLTSDGVAMLLHDATINRTSNGTGTLSNMTYAQVRQYDFGSWKSSEYAGTVIPTFEEFIELCKDISLHPYIELKENGGYTQAQVEALVDTVKEYGMEGVVTWISFSSTYLTYVKNYDANARLGFIVNSVSSSAISTAQGLKTTQNDCFISSLSHTDSECNLCISGNIPLEVGVIDSEVTILSLNPYITGVTSNSLIAGKVLYDGNIA